MPLNATSYAQTVGNFIPGSENIISAALGYLFSLPTLIMQKDYFAIMVSLILLYALIALINKISLVFLVVAKKTISLLVTILALVLIYSKFVESLGTEGFSFNTLIIGLVGIVITILGTIITFYAFFSRTKEAISITVKPQEGMPALEEKPELDLNHIKSFKTFFSLDSLKNDKSLLSVLTFLVVAEFGVFSSATISAPNVQIGVIMFLIFMIFSFVFIKQSYKDYKKGLTHIVITFVLGVILAVILGHSWAGIPFSILFSMQVFATESLVALISGMALSLFAGSRG